jgi:hypothetical protein
MKILADMWSTLQPWWHWIELLIQALMFGLILWALKGSRLKLKAVVDELGEKLKQRIDAVQEAVDQPPTQAPVGADPDSWDRIRELWRDARMRIELRVEAISDRLERRKYNSLSRYTYDGMVRELRKDNLISAEAADALTTMNERFLSLRRARAATAEDAKQFAQLYGRASTELPDQQSPRCDRPTRLGARCRRPGRAHHEASYARRGANFR